MDKLIGRMVRTFVSYSAVTYYYYYYSVENEQFDERTTHTNKWGMGSIQSIV